MKTVADHLRSRALDSPDRIALISSQGNLTFAELDQSSDWFASGLHAIGIRKGSRVALLVTPGPELMTIAFSLVKLGAIPVLVDPGIGRRNLHRCLDEAAPELFIGVPVAVWASLILGWGRKSLSGRVAVGRSGMPGCTTFQKLLRIGKESTFPEAVMRPDDPAAIAFTSGSTGPPKGVVFTHAMFTAQAELLEEAYNIVPGEVDLATFPLFALYDPALRMTTVFPEMDFTRPGHADPRKIIAAIETNQVTHMFGSPALLDRLGRYVEAQKIRLPSLKRVLSAGAPVAPEIAQRLSLGLSPSAEIHTPYGATEALPLTSISHRERALLGGTGAGRGVCVGRALPGVNLAVIRITDEGIEGWTDNLLVPQGEVGELVVWGPNVSSEYFRRPEANRLAKVFEGERVRHRMGDLGYLDASGRFWFCGRKTHRVETDQGLLFSVMVEGIFNQHPAVFRTALVGVGRRPAQRPVLCVELEHGPVQHDRTRIIADLRQLGSRHPCSRSVETFLFHAAFPVDIRHNAKIFREKLALWAEKQLQKLPS
jgi:acyl-CoA synthetase (AMP-forming)/AMP-acid ligase II